MALFKREPEPRVKSKNEPVFAKKESQLKQPKQKTSKSFRQAIRNKVDQHTFNSAQKKYVKNESKLASVQAENEAKIIAAKYSYIDKIGKAGAYIIGGTQTGHGVSGFLNGNFKGMGSGGNNNQNNNNNNSGGGNNPNSGNVPV